MDQHTDLSYPLIQTSSDSARSVLYLSLLINGNCVDELQLEALGVQTVQFLNPNEVKKMNLRIQQGSMLLSRMSLLLVLWQSSFCVAGASNSNKTDLTFMLVTSFGAYGFNSSGTLPAAEIALSAINSREDILPGYNLVYDTIRDSKVCEICTVQYIHCRQTTACVASKFMAYHTQ